VNSLLDSLAAERRRIQELGAEVIYAQDAERARVSRELHDSIAQTLAAARFQIAAASTEVEGDLRNRLAAANGLLGSAMEEVKNVSYSLHPRVAEDLGLEAALGALARQIEGRSGIDVSVTADVVGPPIPTRLSTTLFRVAQEALRNIEVHSHAKSATVNVYSRDGSIRIEVADDGCGFDTTVVNPSTGTSALARVKDRVTLAGGVLRIDSVPDGGTRVTAELNNLKVAS
jgi:signal transduction histidine kinase